MVKKVILDIVLMMLLKFCWRGNWRMNLYANNFGPLLIAVDHKVHKILYCNRPCHLRDVFQVGRMFNEWIKFGAFLF